MTSVIKSYQPLIYFQTVKISSITIDSTKGYTEIINYMPSGMPHFLYAVLWDYGNSAKKKSFFINARGNFISGEPGDTITNITIRYYYTE